MAEIFPEVELKERAIPPCVFVSVREFGHRGQLVASFRCASREVAVTTTALSGTRPSPAACLDDLCALLAGHVCPTAQKRASPGQHGALNAAAEDGGKGGVAKQKRGRPSMAESMKKVSGHLRRGQYLL